jgi:peroxiredoxin
MLCSVVIWYGVALFVRYGGAAGLFTGKAAVQTYFATFLFTIPLNRFLRRLVSLPPKEMLSVAAVCVVLPPFLEGIVMHWYPGFYGGDPAVIRAGAIWILYAIGIGLGLALLTTRRAAGRLEVGDRSPHIIAQTVQGAGVTVPDSQGRLTHVQFLRFAGCPVCNLLLQPYIERSAELRSAGVREVLFFHSATKYIQAYYEPLPLDVIADPQRSFYRQFKVERSPLAILDPFALPNLVRGYLLKRAGKQDSDPFGLPAEFLIDPAGTIVASHYGAHSSDQWLVDDVLAIARRYKNPPKQSNPMASPLERLQTKNSLSR